MVKFLIIRFSSIGDIVLTTSVIRCLKQQVDEAEVHFLTKPAFAPLVENNPHIDKILVLKEKLSETINEIQEEKYDYIIDLHNNLRTFIIKNRTRILSFSFPKLNFEKWLMVNFKINRLPEIHVVDRYFETVKLFDVNNDGKGLELHVPDEKQISISTLPSFLKEGFISVAVGAKHETKRIPENLLIDIIKKVDFPFVLLGDKNDYEIAERIINSSNSNKLFNACGKYNLLESASLVNQSRLIITADTGLMHIAAAFSKKIISIWGNTIPQFGMYPYTSKENYSVFEVKNLSCRPCSKLGYKKCPKKHFKCMTSHDLNEIVKQIELYLNE